MLVSQNATTETTKGVLVVRRCSFACSYSDTPEKSWRPCALYQQRTAPSKNSDHSPSGGLPCSETKPSGSLYSGAKCEFYLALIWPCWACNAEIVASSVGRAATCIFRNGLSGSLIPLVSRKACRFADFQLASSELHKFPYLEKRNSHLQLFVGSWKL